jgi:hypothetical protein
LQEPIENSTRREWHLSPRRYQVIGEERDPQPQLDASKFSNVKIKPMILELSDSTNEDV